MMINLMFRGWRDAEKQFEQYAAFDDSAVSLDTLLPALAKAHSALLAGPKPWMIEIEFLDEPDEMKRYFRMGSDAAGMVEPVRVNRHL